MAKNNDIDTAQESNEARNETNTGNGISLKLEWNISDESASKLFSQLAALNTPTLSDIIAPSGVSTPSGETPNEAEITRSFLIKLRDNSPKEHEKKINDVIGLLFPSYIRKEVETGRRESTEESDKPERTEKKKSKKKEKKTEIDEGTVLLDIVNNLSSMGNSGAYTTSSNIGSSSSGSASASSPNAFSNIVNDPNTMALLNLMKDLALNYMTTPQSEETPKNPPRNTPPFNQ